MNNVYLGAIGATGKGKGTFNDIVSEFEKFNKKLSGMRALDFFYFMYVRQKEIFGKKINRLGFYNLLETYPAIMDVVASYRINMDQVGDTYQSGEKFYRAIKKRLSYIK